MPHRCPSQGIVIVAALLMYVPYYVSLQIVLALKRCWASMWQPHILAYRKFLQVKQLLPSMASVIQVQLDPVASGVLFTVNPTTGNTK